MRCDILDATSFLVVPVDGCAAEKEPHDPDICNIQLLHVLREPSYAVAVALSHDDGAHE